MELFDLLAAVAADLENARVTYALTGSIATSLYGRPQLSYDADLVCRMTPQQAESLAALWQRRFYVSVDALRDACENGGLANVVDAASGWKVDLSVPPPEPYYLSAFSRRRRTALPGSSESIWVCSPEDAILMKLLWRIESRSRKQFNDALNVVESMGNRLDWEYLRDWAARLGLAADLEELRRAGVE